MPRRNLYLLVLISLVSFVCYRKADSAHRSHYGRLFDAFKEVMTEIQDNYVDPIDDRALLEGALEGMVNRLDPYSAYIGPQKSPEFRSGLKGRFGGVGIEVSWDRKDKTLTVMSPLVDTPAYKQGILAGDRILEIDGESTEKITLEDAVQRLRGEPGEPVELTVLHEGEDDPVRIKIVRAVIKVDTVLGDTRTDDDKWNFLLQEEPRIGYVRITSFGERTFDELEAALETLRQRNMEALILDLRNNAGGLLSAATETCQLFIKRGRIVSTVGRKPEVHYDAEVDGPYTDFPMAVLVNRFSASASEIVAACLQDHQRATIIGQRTWGKGTVQNIISVENGRSTLKLTTASYWRPSGKNIHRAENAPESDDWGVHPDPGFEVVLTNEELVKMIRHRRNHDVVRSAGGNHAETKPDDAQAAEPYVDPQLQKAVEYLEGRLRDASRSVGKLSAPAE